MTRSRSDRVGLERLLNDALSAHRPALTAYQRGGLNLASVAPDYDPEPDVVVVDADGDDSDCYSDRFCLAAEIVSRSDRKTVESKGEISERHPDCRCVPVIQQDRFDVRIGDARTEHQLADPKDQLILEEFGLRCVVADLCRGTKLQPRGKPGLIGCPPRGKLPIAFVRRNLLVTFDGFHGRKTCESF
jgi:hypothetical protein